VLGPHHRWATGTLFDNIKASTRMSVTEYASSSGGHAWCGAQTVGWNLECSSYVCDAAPGSQNYLIGSIGTEAKGPVSYQDHPESVFRGYWEKSGVNGVHVKTRSLYLKQLEDRLGVAAVNNMAIPEQLTGNIYAKLTAWAGNSMLDSVNTTSPPVSKIIANCDISTGWISNNTLTINTNEKKEGAACLQSVGAGTDDFRRVFAQPINTGASIETDSLQFWYYVNNVSLFSTANQVELGSGGKADVDEFSWDIGPLVNGWNLISLPFNKANVIGTPDLNAINWFRLYRFKSGNTTTRIDQIFITNNSLSYIQSVFSPDMLRIYTSPADQGKLIIKVADEAKWNDAEVIITNLHGQVVYRNLLINNKMLEINTKSLLQSSIYVVSVRSGHSGITKKIVVH
jgi:hypothetical protein